MRLLTIFFCGPTIVTPTFFRSLVCQGEMGEGETEGRVRWSHTNSEGERHDGEMGRKRGEVLALKDVTPWRQSVTCFQCWSFHFPMHPSLTQDCISQKATRQPCLRRCFNLLWLTSREWTNGGAALISAITTLSVEETKTQEGHRDPCVPPFPPLSFLHYTELDFFNRDTCVWKASTCTCVGHRTLIHIHLIRVNTIRSY